MLRRYPGARDYSAFSRERGLSSVWRVPADYSPSGRISGHPSVKRVCQLDHVQGVCFSAKGIVGFIHSSVCMIYPLSSPIKEIVVYVNIISSQNHSSLYPS